MENKKIVEYSTMVLGGGPVGMAISAILKLPVVTEMAMAPKGPVFLYDTPYTRKFLDDVHHPSSKSMDIKIGYHFKGETFQHPSPEAQHEYSVKMAKETEYYPKPFKYIPVHWPSLLISCRRFIPKTMIDRVVSIDLDAHEMVGSRGTVYHYGKLISTVPAPVFAHLINDNWHLQYLPVSMKEVNISMVPGYIGWKKYDYVYICDKDDPRYRWTKTSNERMGLVEKVLGINERPNQYRILSGTVPEVEDVRFFGRFGRWEEDRFIHDDIKDVYNEVYK
jgi:hypothetical protein